MSRNDMDDQLKHQLRRAHKGSLRLPFLADDVSWRNLSARWRRLSSRRAVISLCALLSIFSALLFIYTSASRHVLVTPDSSLALEHKALPVLGPATQCFRDNLKNDTQYITSWVSAGWTNDVCVKVVFNFIEIF